MKSVKFAEKIAITGSREDIFDYTQDYGSRLNWDTFLVEANLLNGALQAGKGVKVWCVARNGIGMETEYITFNRPKATAVRMTKGPYMFNTFLGTWTFRELTKETTEVIFLYSFKLRFPYYFFKVFIKRKLQKNVRQRLIDLKRNFESMN